jgi:hypothetical protein
MIVGKGSLEARENVLRAWAAELSRRHGVRIIVRPRQAPDDHQTSGGDRHAPQEAQDGQAIRRNDPPSTDGVGNDIP